MMFDTTVQTNTSVCVLNVILDIGGTATMMNQNNYLRGVLLRYSKNIQYQIFIGIFYSRHNLLMKESLLLK